jgi:hypothetical protein
MRQSEPDSPTEWWLDWSALPERLLWARLLAHLGGRFSVHDCDGKLHWFECRQDAVMWLAEDEYSALIDLVSEGEVPSDTTPPAAA